MELRKFKKRIRSYGQGQQVKFLAKSTIEKKWGWSYNSVMGGAYKDKFLYELNENKNYKLGRVIKVRQVSEFMDYKCDFDDCGDCRETRKPNSHWKDAYRNNKKCCCACCASEMGYIRVWPSNKLAEFAEIFDERNGFWKEGVGCQLKRTDRSETCLRYCCHPDERFRDSMYTYGTMIRKIEDEILELQRKENAYIRLKNTNTKRYHCDLCGVYTEAITKERAKEGGIVQIKTSTNQTRTVCNTCRTKLVNVKTGLLGGVK